MGIRKRASTASLPTIREDQFIRIALRAALASTELDIKNAEAFGDDSEQLTRMYERQAYLAGHLQYDGKLKLDRV